MAEATTREYAANAHSSGTFGRVLWNVRDHYFVADGPASNGCPGAAVSPGEMFLAAIGSCAVELIEVLARRGNIELDAVHAAVRGVLGGGTRGQGDVALFDLVEIDIRLDGVTQMEAGELVGGFTHL